MIPDNVSTITRRAYDTIVSFHGFILGSNHKRLRLNRIEMSPMNQMMKVLGPGSLLGFQSY